MKIVSQVRVNSSRYTIFSHSGFLISYTYLIIKKDAATVNQVMQPNPD